MRPPTTVAPDEAAQTLQSVRAAREAADRRLAANWLPLVVAGVLLFMSFWFFDVWDGAGVSVFWLAVSPFALYAVKRYDRIQMRLSGAIRNRRGWVLYAGSFIAACIVCGVVGGATGTPDIINFGPPFGIVAAYAAVAIRDRSLEMAGWAGVVAAIATVAIVLDAGHPAPVFAAAIGGVLIMEGFSDRNKRGA